MTDTHPTDIDVHRGANQSIITAEIADTELAVLVAEGADVGPGAFTNALDDVIGALSERVATESGFYGELPPVEQVEQELATDGGRHYICALCDRRHPTTGAALECCSDRFEDDDLLADGGRTYRDVPNVMGPMDVARPAWAERYGVGDRIRFESPDGDRSAQVIGFSTHDEYAGRPVVEMPDGLLEYYDDDPGLLIVTEQYHLPPEEEAVRTDGGAIEVEATHPECHECGRELDRRMGTDMAYVKLVAHDPTQQSGGTFWACIEHVEAVAAAIREDATLETSRELVTDGGTTALEPITLDDVSEGDRVRVTYDVDRSESGCVTGEIIEVEPSVTDHREVRSAILDAENGRQYRVLFGGVSEVHADNEVVVGHSASLHREVGDER